MEFPTTKTYIARLGYRRRYRDHYPIDWRPDSRRDIRAVERVRMRPQILATKRHCRFRLANGDPMTDLKSVAGCRARAASLRAAACAFDNIDLRDGYLEMAAAWEKRADELEAGQEPSQSEDR